jgi:hypothetical protein
MEYSGAGPVDDDMQLESEIYNATGAVRLTTILLVTLLHETMDYGDLVRLVWWYTLPVFVAVNVPYKSVSETPISFLLVPIILCSLCGTLVF